MCKNEILFYDAEISVLSASEFRSFPPNSVDFRKSTDFLPNFIDLRHIHRILGRRQIIHTAEQVVKLIGGTY